MVIPHCTNSVDIGAIVRANTHMFRGKGLQVPIGRLIGVLEDIVGQKTEAWALKAGRHDHHVAFYNDFVAWAVFGDALGAVVKSDTCFGEADDVATEPFRFAGADHMKDVGIDLHSCQ